MNPKATLVWAGLVLGSPAWAVPVESVPNPRLDGGWTTDAAGVLDDAAEARIDALAEGLKRDIGVEVAVVTLDAVDGTPKAFATRLFNHWGIGEAAYDNGLLVLLVMGERRLEMEVGIGLEDSLPDAWLGEMQATVMVPRFKAGDFGGGIEAGVRAVDERLRQAPGEGAAPSGWAPREPATPLAVPTGEVAPAVPVTPYVAPVADEPSPWSVFGLLAGLAAGAGGVALRAFTSLGATLMVPFAGVVRWWTRCPSCGAPTVRLDEIEDDAHLDRDQKAEEKLGSVDWVVRICTECQATRVSARERWFSGYSRCPGCRRRTCRVSKKTLRTATTEHGGEVEKSWACGHCGYRHSERHATPRRTPSSSGGSHWKSSSSSSRRSGGFGGGRSRGGGRGSSW